MDFEISTFDFIEFLLLNLSFIFVLFFIYHKLLEKHNSHIRKSLFCLVSGFSIICCMTFSVALIEGYIFDMRLVPFIIGALYGGRKCAFSLLLILLTYRFFLGGSGFLVTVFEYSFIYCLLYVFIPAFQNAAKKQKVKIAVLISTTDAVSLLFMLNDQTLEQFPLLLILFLVQIIGVMLFVIFIEKVREETQILLEMKKLEKLKIISELAASISHEVRNPLTVVRGFLQFLKGSEVSEEKKQRYINLSMVELNRAEVIITDYLTFAKPNLENIEVLDAAREMDYVVNVLNPYATMTNVNIQWKRTAVISVLGEKQMFHQCLINVMKNGIEAMPTGGLLSIRMEETVDSVTIYICDTGVGMHEDQIIRLGEPYYSTKEKGTGLGTMVSYSIVQAMHGKIEVNSKIDQGTAFTIILPAVS